MPVLRTVCQTIHRWLPLAMPSTIWERLGLAEVQQVKPQRQNTFQKRLTFELVQLLWPVASAPLPRNQDTVRKQMADEAEAGAASARKC